MESFEEKLIKTKIVIDEYVGCFSNDYKFLFLIDKMNINQPKQICEKLNMAKSNLALLASKLKFLRYISQTKINNKEILYNITDIGKRKLQEKIEKLQISTEKQELIAKIIKNL